MKTHIYTLADPRTGDIRYIGKANNLHKRYKNHLNPKRNIMSHKSNWIMELKKIGMKPIIEILDTVDIKDWTYWETYWIWQIKCWGFDLCNHTEGGDGASFANMTSFKKGHGSISVVALYKDGKFYKKYNSILDATIEHNKGVESVIYGYSKSANGYLWLKYDDYIHLLNSFAYHISKQVYRVLYVLL